MSYNARSGHGYGDQKRSGFGGKGRGKKRTFNPLTLAKRSFEKRSKRSQEQDLRQIAQLAPNLAVYLKNPERFDLPFIDMPRDQNETVKVLCKLAAKEPCELTVKDTEAKKTKRIKVVKKEDVKAETEKAVKEAEEKAKTAGRKLPTKEEIFDRAVEIWRKDNGYLDDVANPDATELREEGFLNRAKVGLMTSTAGEGERAIGDYVDKVRNELLTLGYDVVPLTGAVPDVSLDEGKWSDYLASQ